MDYMSIQGICRVYENDSLVAETKNLVTEYGKSQIPLMLSGRGGFVTSIGVGASNEAALSHIKVEIAKEQIVFATPTFSSPDSARVTYKARLGDEVSGVINEISLFNYSSGGRTVYNTGVRETRSGTFTDVTGLAGDPAAGSDKVRLGETSASVATGQFVEVTRETSLSGILPAEFLTVSGYNATSSANASTVTVLLTDAYGVTASRAFVFGTSSTAYQSISQAISSFATGSGFDWGRIAKCRFTVSGSSSPAVVIDGLTARSDSITGKALTRAVYGAPVVKRHGSRMDIEYELAMTI